ncbi:calmodulin-like isoform X2 [Mytilus californianus]|uniref:calmodulin-like isoform X1 n=1 Tax=Mytilus californianus TaxID=6549 RepID=UPI0022457F84|nr:calmodulin-like isoform X1 [Mytilus californianus]XP_052105261.1 calmodulin-like isoform X2 [Mytilus californianus]
MASDFTEDQLEEIQNLFKHFNKKKDKKLSSKDLGLLMRAFNQSPTEAELQDIIKEIDQRGNEGIDYEEFLELLSDAMKQQCTDDDYKDVFNVYDSDGNGIISSDEFRAAMNSMGENLSKEEAEEMIMEADSDGDGHIDLAEFIKMMREK